MKFILTSAFATLAVLQKHTLGNSYFDTEKIQYTPAIIVNYFNVLLPIFLPIYSLPLML